MKLGRRRRTYRDWRCPCRRRRLLMTGRDAAHAYTAQNDTYRAGLTPSGVPGRMPVL